jgi:hypothetical protein
MSYALQMAERLTSPQVLNCDSLAWSVQARRAHMEPIVFAVLSLAACAFLMYVFVNFHRELANARKRNHQDSKVPSVHLLRVERALQSARASLHAGREQQMRVEAVVRRGTLISGIVGLFGLLALFVLMMLLNSSSVWHH